MLFISVEAPSGTKRFYSSNNFEFGRGFLFLIARAPYCTRSNFIELQKWNNHDKFHNLNILLTFSLILKWQGGYGYGAKPTFLYCGEYRVVETCSFSVENVLIVKRKFSGFQKHPKNFKTVDYWKSYKRFSVGLSDTKMSRYIYHTSYPCMVYMVHAW